MKKIFLLLSLLCICMAGYSKGDGETAKVRSKYVNIGFSGTKFEQDDISTSADYGAFLTIGRTFYLHKTPILNLIKIGIDASWLDLNYANFSKPFEIEKGTFHNAEAAMHIGPSVTVTPLNNLNVCAYLRYAPTFTALYSTVNDNYNLGYATRFVCGASLSYKVIGVGVEARFGKNKYEPFEAFLNDIDDAEKVNTKMAGCRVYLTFRF